MNQKSATGSSPDKTTQGSTYYENGLCGDTSCHDGPGKEMDSVKLMLIQKFGIMVNLRQLSTLSQYSLLSN